METKNKYDLAIVYRIYPKVSKIPPIFPNDKLKLSELCLASFADSIKNLNCKIWVLLDNCPAEYEVLFHKYLANKDYELIKLSGEGNGATFKRQLEILTTQDFSEIVYFAEDDYFYLPDAFTNMLYFIHSSDEINYISPYDHLDYYTLSFHQINNDTKTYQGLTWKSVASTTMTFMCKKSDLIEDYSTFLSYASRNNSDASLWMAITKYNALNPLKIISSLFQNFGIFKMFAKLYVFTWKELIFNRKKRLYAPVPSLALHLDNQCIAPNIEWDLEFQKVLDKIHS